jgi:hypothetical protein
MTNIRVDPASLRQKAKELEQHAEQMRNLAERVLRSAESAPSYDGQFGPRVRALAAEAHAELTRRASDVRESAEQLCDTAARFEQVDLETVAGMEGLALRMQGWVDRSVGVLTAWAQSPSGQSFSQRVSSLASEAEEGDHPWWAPIVLGWQGTWAWFDLSIGGPIREGLLTWAVPPAASGHASTPIGTPRPGGPGTASTDGTAVPMGLASPVPLPVPRPETLSDESNIVTPESLSVSRHPFLDPEANENRTITAQMRFVEPPFSSLEGNPNDPEVDLSRSKLALLIQGADLIRSFVIDHANADFMASVGPNVDFTLHYSTYDDGVRIPGIRIDNHSEMPVVIGRIEMEQWSTASEGALGTVLQYQHLQETEVVIKSGGFEYLQFDLSAATFPRDARIDVRAFAMGAASPAPFGRIGWSVWGFGSASQLPPGP